MEQSEGQLIVSAVLPGGPADAAGLHSGDEVLLINGKRASEMPCGAQTWGSTEQPNTTALAVKRDAKVLRLTVRLEDVRQLLANKWLTRSAGFENASLLSDPLPQGAGVYGPYMTGIRIARGDNHRMIVADVLGDSPAYDAGVLPRDEIVAVDGIPAEKVTAVLQSALISGGRRYEIRLEILRHGYRKSVTLESASLAYILSKNTRSVANLPEVSSLNQ